MSDHLTSQQIGDYRSRKVSAEELSRIDAHLADCPACARLLISPERTARATAAWRELAAPTLPLSYEQLEAYVEGRLPAGAREEIEARLRVDADARADVESMRAAQSMVTNEPVILPGMQNRQGAVSARSGAARPGIGWRGASLSLAGACAAALLVWAGGVRPLLRQNADLRAEVQRSLKADTPSPQSLQAALDKARAQGAQQATQQLAQTQSRLDALAKQSAKQKDALTEQVRRQERATADARRQSGRLARINSDLRRDLSLRSVASVASSGVRIPANSSDLAAIASAFKQATLPLHMSAELAVPAVSIPRGEEEPASPAGTVVLPDRPTLRWNALSGAASYQVIVTDRSDKVVAQTASPLRAPQTDFSSPAPQMQWTVPTALRRGQVYRWQVQPLDAQGRPIRNNVYAKLPFEILSRDALTRYLDAQLKLAILYARDGLYDRAETLLAEVADADAANPLCAQAAKLRQDIRRQRETAAQSGH